VAGAGPQAICPAAVALKGACDLRLLAVSCSAEVVSGVVDKPSLLCVAHRSLIGFQAENRFKNGESANAKQPFERKIIRETIPKEPAAAFGDFGNAEIS